MCDLINLVIKCTGCDLQVDVHDIEDPDNAVSKLTDLQDEYQTQKYTDYPLISKAKGNASFRATMTGFFETLISTCHAAGLLYSDLAIIENVEVWVSTMSSSAIRPFRHTATVISLTIGNTLCAVAADVAENTAKTMRQKEGEQRKKSVNKERVKSLEAKVAEGDRRRAQVVESLQAIFDTVFVHRYRDVDPKIRAECVIALGTWIVTLPEVYFEGIYIRYLGWVLSDTFAPTRAEVIKQLCKLFKNKENVARLRTFTERFRDRLVEMAVRDSEISIRAATVELLDMIRKTGLLEPDDIDTVGRLVFDTEPRVRKAVVGFFAENINDLFETTLEELGGEEGLVELLGEEVEDDYDSPRISWMMLKCVAEALLSYDAEGEEDDSETRRVDGGMIATGADTRFTLAAQTICEGIPEAKQWELIAGYLLYDFSIADQSKEGADATFKARCMLKEREEVLLLEILNVSVKNRLLEAVESETDKKGKKTKARKEESREIQESAALHLATVIPQLLKKFGSDSATASAVLRLEHVLNLEIFQELRQDSTTYASLLDDINKQFLTHADQNVLAEASSALLHAREFDDLEEVTGAKVQDLWDETISALRTLMNAGIGDNISDIRNTVRRIANLARVSDCIAVFDLEGRSNSKMKSNASTMNLLSLLNNLIRDPELDPEAGDEANEIIISATKALLFYYMWTVHSVQSAITSNEPIPSIADYIQLSQTLITFIETRHSTSSVRLAATGTLLDLYTLFGTFRHIQLSSTHQANADRIHTFVRHIPVPAQHLILSTFTALEKSFAKKSHRSLEAAPDDDLASDPEDSDDEDDDGDSHAQQETLIAEKRLCEMASRMVLAIVGRVIDHDGPNKGTIRERLARNKGRLGSNFKEVLSHLDEPKAKPKRKGKAGVTRKKLAKPVEVEEEESDEEPQVEEGGEEDLRNRELAEDRIVDPDGESAGEGGLPGEDGFEDEDVMGD